MQTLPFLTGHFMNFDTLLSVIVRAYGHLFYFNNILQYGKLHVKRL